MKVKNWEKTSLRKSIESRNIKVTKRKYRLVGLILRHTELVRAVMQGKITEWSKNLYKQTTTWGHEANFSECGIWIEGLICIFHSL